MCFGDALLVTDTCVIKSLEQEGIYSIPTDLTTTTDTSRLHCICTHTQHCISRNAVSITRLGLMNAFIRHNKGHRQRADATLKNRRAVDKPLTTVR